MKVKKEIVTNFFGDTEEIINYFLDDNPEIQVFQERRILNISFIVYPLLKYEKIGNKYVHRVVWWNYEGFPKKKHFHEWKQEAIVGIGRVFVKQFTDNFLEKRIFFDFRSGCRVIKSWSGLQTQSLTIKKRKKNLR